MAVLNLAFNGALQRQLGTILSWINELVVRMKKERKKWGEMDCSDAVKEREKKKRNFFKKINRMQELKKRYINNPM